MLRTLKMLRHPALCSSPNLDAHQYVGGGGNYTHWCAIMMLGNDKTAHTIVYMFTHRKTTAGAMMDVQLQSYF